MPVVWCLNEYYSVIWKLIKYAITLIMKYIIVLIVLN